MANPILQLLLLWPLLQKSKKIKSINETLCWLTPEEGLCLAANKQGLSNVSKFSHQPPTHLLVSGCGTGTPCESDNSFSHPKMASHAYLTVSSLPADLLLLWFLVDVIKAISLFLQQWNPSSPPSTTPFRTCRTSSGSSLRLCPPSQWLGAGMHVAEETEFKPWFSPTTWVTSVSLA